MDQQINNIINEYKRKLDASGIKVKAIYLYGSYAHGLPREDSDIDLLIISDDFQNMDLWDRQCTLGRARIGLDRPMEIIGLTEKEFEREDSGSFIADEIKEKGVEVRA